MVRFGVNSCGFVKNKTAPYRDSLLYEIWISDSASNEKSCLPFESVILPLLKHTCGEQQLASILAIKRLAVVVPEVNLGKCTSHMHPPSVNKAAYSGFEVQRICHQKSIIGVSVAP